VLFCLPTVVVSLKRVPPSTQVELLLHDLCREGLLLPSALAVILDADGYCDAAVGGVVIVTRS
jgi:hypothetical protein